MKKSAWILLVLLVVGILLGSCRSKELCPAYQSKVAPKVEKKA